MAPILPHMTHMSLVWVYWSDSLLYTTTSLGITPSLFSWGDTAFFNGYTYCFMYVLFLNVKIEYSLFLVFLVSVMRFIYLQFRFMS